MGEWKQNRSGRIVWTPSINDLEASLHNSRATLEFMLGH